MVARSLAKTSPRTRAARARSLATRTTLRSTRSARTPASGLAMVGSRRATSAPTTEEALPVIWTTRTTSATIETASPTNEVPWPTQSRKKRAFLRRDSPVESIPLLDNETHHLASVARPTWWRELLSLTDGAGTRLCSGIRKAQAFRMPRWSACQHFSWSAYWECGVNSCEYCCRVVHGRPLGPSMDWASGRRGRASGSAGGSHRAGDAYFPLPSFGLYPDADAIGE